jgi:excisionase family DNA binding protein
LWGERMTDTPSGATRELLSVEEVAEYLGVVPMTIYRWCREGRLPCLKIGRVWRIRRGTLEDFLKSAERPATLVGQLGSFLTVPDNVIAIAQDRELLHRLDAAFFKVGEAQGGILVKFAGGEPDVLGGEARTILERHGLEVPRLEEEGRFRLSQERGPLHERRELLERLIMEEADSGRTVWASFNWAEHVDLEAALSQQEALTDMFESNQLVVKTAVLEEVADGWPAKAQRRARESHTGTIWLSEAGLSLSRVMPLPQED